MKKIVVINGMGSSGKDTFCEFCNGVVSIMNISSVDKVKEAAIILGWDGGKSEIDRKFLADLGYLSTEYNDGRYSYINEKIKEFQNSECEILFIHIREVNFIERMKNDFNAETLLIRNENVPNIQSNEADANVFNYEYDFIIDNNGSLYDLAWEATNFVNCLRNDY